MVKTRLYQKCCIKTARRADGKLVITNKEQPKGRLRLLTKSYYKLKLRHSRESGNLVINNLLFLLIFWIPAFAGMTVFFLGFVLNLTTEKVCQHNLKRPKGRFFISATMGFIQALFTDTKTRENHAEQIVGSKLAGDGVELLLREAQLLGE